jgi:hypothetical protein
MNIWVRGIWVKVIWGHGLNWEKILRDLYLTLILN